LQTFGEVKFVEHFWRAVNREGSQCDFRQGAIASVMRIGVMSLRHQEWRISQAAL